MDRATIEIVTLIETLGATAYGANRMALAIDIEINREAPTTKRIDEFQSLAGRCIDLDAQRKYAVEIATRLNKSSAPLGKTLNQLVLDFTANASVVQRLCILGRDWTSPDSMEVLKHLTSVGILLAEQFSQICSELERLDTSNTMSTTTRIKARVPRRGSAFGRRIAIDEVGL